MSGYRYQRTGVSYITSRDLTYNGLVTMVTRQSRTQSVSISIRTRVAEGRLAAQRCRDFA